MRKLLIGKTPFGLNLSVVSGASAKRVQFGSSAAATIPHVPSSVARYGLSGIAPGYRCVQDDDGQTYQYHGPRDTRPAVVVSGGTAAGVYTLYAENFGGSGHNAYTLPGSAGGPDETGGIYADAGGWYIQDANGTPYSHAPYPRRSSTRVGLV